ncbi:MAG: Na+/H+ antiporter NhaA [Myxococcota bacterium]
MTAVRVDPVDRLLRPIDRFMQAQTSGGILLVAAAVVAMVWANSPWRDAYHDLWHHVISLRLDDHALDRTIHHWINDGLMAMFFFVVGLELKREIVGGELSRPTAAILPVAAGLGGMVVPGLLYASLNAGGGEAAGGWGIPMATDIAFAVGVLSLLGKRVPVALKVFLTTLAIADDLGAVLVIAFFYSSDVSLVNLAIGMLFLAILMGGNWLGVRSPLFYGLFGIGGVWLAFLMSGVHATVAGVLAAMTIPASVKVDEQGFVRRMREHMDEFARLDPNQVQTLTEAQLHTIDRAIRLAHHATTPVQLLEHRLGPFVVYVVMPLFALANAGVELPADVGGALLSPVALGVLLGLLVGKPVGILFVCWLTVRLGLARVGEAFGWRHLVGAAFLGGIGFTMSLFVGELALESESLRNQAKLAILVASLLAGAIGFAVLRRATAPADESTP